ncbi:MAG: hypothetical protein ACQESW_12715 [Bacteroidota bacterium]
MSTPSNNELVKIRSVNDLKFAKAIYRQEARIHEQAFSIGVSTFKANFEASLKITVQRAIQRLLYMGAVRLMQKNKHNQQG